MRAKLAIATFAPPKSRNTCPQSIESHGTIAGRYMLSVEYPGSQDTTATAIMQGITGSYFDGKVWHGFLCTH